MSCGKMLNAACTAARRSSDNNVLEIFTVCSIAPTTSALFHCRHHPELSSADKWSLECGLGVGCRHHLPSCLVACTIYQALLHLQR